MTSPEQAIHLLFWPLTIFAVAFAFFAVVFLIVVWVMSRRTPGHHPLVAGPQGSNTYDASSHTMTNITVDKISVGRLPGPE